MQFFDLQTSSSCFDQTCMKYQNLLFTQSFHFASTSYASMFCFINRSDTASTSSVAAIFSFSALLKSITRYRGTLFFNITAVPCSSTTLTTLEKFWFASVIEIIVFVSIVILHTLRFHLYYT